MCHSIRDYNVPKQTLHGWMEDKKKIYEGVEASHVAKTEDCYL